MDFKSKFCIVIAIAVLSAFVGIASLSVISHGLCCGDDASNAILAKNLAWGYGYAHSVDYASAEFSMRKFDSTMISTGPTVIIPASMAIWLFGNKYWVPGATQIFLWLICLLLIYRYLWAVAGAKRSSIAMTIFIALIYLFSAKHFEQWYILIGEVPQALLVLLSVIIWSVEPHSRYRLAAASLLMGLSVLTKSIGALYAASFLVGVGWWYIRHDKNGRFGKKTTQIFLIAFCMLMPLICFELWKLASLGPHLYAEEAFNYFRHLKSLGIAADQPSLLQRLNDRTQQFFEHYGVSLPTLLMLAGFSTFFSAMLASLFIRRLAIVLLVGVITHAGYWLILSVGWPRYFYSGLVILCFLISLPLLILQYNRERVLYLLATVLLSMSAVGRMEIPSLPSPLWMAPPGSLAENQVQASKYLNNHRNRRPIFGSWGGAVADMEYLSEGVLDFKTWRALQPDNYEKGFLLITNYWLDGFARDYAKFKALFSQCGAPVVTEPPYAVYDCQKLKIDASLP